MGPELSFQGVCSWGYGVYVGCLGLSRVRGLALMQALGFRGVAFLVWGFRVQGCPRSCFRVFFRCRFAVRRERVYKFGQSKIFVSLCLSF